MAFRDPSESSTGGKISAEELRASCLIFADSILAQAPFENDVTIENRS